MKSQEVHKQIRSIETYLDMVKNKVEAIEEVVALLKSEYRDYDAKMKNVDIAEFLDVSETTVWRMLKDGRLKSRRMKHVLELKNKR